MVGANVAVGMSMMTEDGPEGVTNVEPLTGDSEELSQGSGRYEAWWEWVHGRKGPEDWKNKSEDHTLGAFLL